MKLCHPWCANPFGVRCQRAPRYPGCAGTPTPNGDDGAMSSLPGDVFKTDNFLMNLLLSKVPFAAFLCCCRVLAGEGGLAGCCPALAWSWLPLARQAGVGALSPLLGHVGCTRVPQLTHHLPGRLLVSAERIVWL